MNRLGYVRQTFVGRPNHPTDESGRSSRFGGRAPKNKDSVASHFGQRRCLIRLRLE
ncbi:MAG: hypothetical protein AB8H12_24315 [Lewinella sp.]